MTTYKSMTIKKAMHCIETKEFVLPAIQRKFVWSMEQIEMLFDSLLRGYPINSFMIWRIKDNKIRNDYEFYSFIRDYVQKFKENNPSVASEHLNKVVYAIVDGQQRLTSIYIGLSGSYKIKKANKRWTENEQTTLMDKKELYLEVTKKLPTNLDNEKMYNFRFMSKEEYEAEKNTTNCWFKVGDILKYNNKSIERFLRKEKLLSNRFSTKTLNRLYEVVHKENVINYYSIDEQNQDRVLEMFIRANSGGTPLSFSDLLMSMSSAYWKKMSPKAEIDDIRKQIGSYGNPTFNVSQDFILKSMLVLSDVDVKFKVESFSRDNIIKFEEKWEGIKKSLTATFELLEQLNFNDDILRAKNAAIPIAYYIYINNLAKKIVKPIYLKSIKEDISKWLSMSLLSGIFGGTSDTVLATIRTIIKKSKSKSFPINEIIERLNKTSGKNYLFDDKKIEELLNSQYGTSTCGIVLNLLYSKVVINSIEGVDQDHMHPRSIFEKKKNSILKSLKLSKTKIEFFANKSNYNSCLNLQLIEKSVNKSKGDMPLKDWVKRENKTYRDLHVKADTPYDIKYFDKFISDRRKVLKKELKRILKM